MTKRAIINLVARAEREGIAAGLAAQPAPMIVQQHQHVLDDNSPVTQEWFVGEGMCGFATVVVRPGTSALARYIKTRPGGHKNYYGGVGMFARAIDHSGRQAQSYERNVAYATAYAKVLEGAGFTAYVTSRLD